MPHGHDYKLYGHDYKPRPRWQTVKSERRTKKSLFLGFELEVECGECDDETVQQVSPSGRIGGGEIDVNNERQKKVCRTVEASATAPRQSGCSLAGADAKTLRT